MNEICTTIFKHGKLILATFISTVITVAIGTFLLKPTYESKAALLVKFGREYIYMPTLHDEKGPLNYYNREGIVNNEIEIISSKDLLEKTIATVGVDTLYPDLAANPPKNKPVVKIAEQQFRDNLSIQGGKDTDILKISFRHENPQIAAKTINILIDLFREKHLRTLKGDNSTAFLENKVLAYRSELATAEEALKEFRDSHSLFAIDEQRSALLKQQAFLDASLMEANKQMSGLQGRLSSLNQDASHTKQDAHLRTEAGKSFTDITDKAKEQLLTLELKEKELARSFNDDNRLLDSTRNQVELVKKFVDDQQINQGSRVITGTNEIYLELHKQQLLTRADIEMESGASGVLRQQLDTVNGNLKSMLANETALRVLERDAAAKLEIYRSYLSKLQEFKLSDEMDQSKVSTISIVQSADVPIKPIRPIKILNLAMGVLLGILAGITLAMLKEYLSQQISTPETAEKRLGLKVLATIDLKDKAN